jgi:hypothetical protein
MAELDLKTGIIVTRNEEERIATDAGIIEAIPAWRFLLDIPAHSGCRRIAVGVPSWPLAIGLQIFSLGHASRETLPRFNRQK